MGIPASFNSWTSEENIWRLVDHGYGAYGGSLSARTSHHLMQTWTHFLQVAHHVMSTQSQHCGYVVHPMWPNLEVCLYPNHVAPILFVTNMPHHLFFQPRFFLALDIHHKPGLTGGAYYIQNMGNGGYLMEQSGSPVGVQLTTKKYKGGADATWWILEAGDGKVHIQNSKFHHNLQQADGDAGPKMVGGDEKGGWESFTLTTIDGLERFCLPPTPLPTRAPTSIPTVAPSKAPTHVPTRKPTKAPTSKPTKAPTVSPTRVPTKKPTKAPISKPTKIPTQPTGSIDVLFEDTATRHGAVTLAEFKSWVVPRGSDGHGSPNPVRVSTVKAGTPSPKNHPVDVAEWKRVVTTRRDPQKEMLAARQRAALQAQTQPQSQATTAANTLEQQRMKALFGPVSPQRLVVQDPRNWATHATLPDDSGPRMALNQPSALHLSPMPVHRGSPEHPLQETEKAPD